MKGIPELPLLRRELTELSNRRRTYVVRVLGAIIILFFVFVAYQDVIAGRMSYRMTFEMGGMNRFLGIGGDVFEAVTPKLFYIIQILMPAFCCACITSEKESNTIGTLLLTRLSPGTIIIEKFFSRLIPMLTLLLLTFPILAYVHSLGGVDTDLLIGTLWLLLCECFLFASIAILCSAWFTTTVSAFTVSYALTAFQAIMSFSLELRTFVPSAIYSSFFLGGQEPSLSLTSEVALAFMTSLAKSMQFVGIPIPVGRWLLVVAMSVPSLLVTACCLMAARGVLVPRAFVTHSSVLMRIFRAVDSFFKELNDRTTGGVVLIKDSETLPGDQPVVWREQNKKSLGKARYLFRILVILEGPTLFICMMAATLSARNAFQGLYFLEGLIWMFALLVVVVKSATLFSSERANQTIEPLLATPMTATSMLDQKVTGMKRLLIVLAVPIMTVHFTHFMLNVNFSISQLFSFPMLRTLTYLLLSLAATIVLLHLIVWLTAGIGLRIYAQTRAVLTSLTVIALWCLLPFLLTAIGLRGGFVFNNLLLMLSPVSIIMFLEAFVREPMMGNIYDPATQQKIEPWFIAWAIGALLTYFIVTLVLRSCMRHLSPRLLGRLESPATPSLAAKPAASRVTLLEGAQS